MTRLIGTVMAVALLVSIAPVLASDTFHALSRLPATAQASLTPMDEAQLAAIEGAQVSQSNAATVKITQSNAFTGTGSGAGRITQSNAATVKITQSNAFTGTGSGAGRITQSNAATVTITQSNAATVR